MFFFSFWFWNEMKQKLRYPVLIKLFKYFTKMHRKWKTLTWKMYGLICHILKAKIKRPVLRKLSYKFMNFSLIPAIEFPKKKNYGSSENWKLKTCQKFSTNSLFFNLILFFLFVLTKRVRQKSGSSHSNVFFKECVHRKK